jgi:hypothetical protein
MNVKNSIHGQISRKIGRFPQGKLFFPADFKGMGTEGAVKMSLLRLVREGKLSKVAHGIYALPKLDPVLGKIPPSLEMIARAIAVRDRARIKPSGAYALNKLGLTTQVPMKLVYLTDGAPRYVRVGKRSIKFKPATPKTLAYRGEITSLVAPAFKELGQKNVTPEMINKVRRLLSREKPEALRSDAKLAPYWIASIFYDVLKEKQKSDALAN